MRWLIATGAALLGGAAMVGVAAAPTGPKRPSGPTRDGRVLYLPAAAAPYGPYHGARRPRGLPMLVAEAHGPAGILRLDGVTEARADGTARRIYQLRTKSRASRVLLRRVRKASARGAALPHVRRIAGEHALGEAFVKTMLNLAAKEGEGGTFAVPARNFNSPCRNRFVDKARRCTTVDAPRSGALITAWGVFQWNRDAGRLLAALDSLGLNAPAIPSDWMPWDWSASEELELPIDYYAQLWRLVQRHGGTRLDAARGVRLWHTGPTRFRRYIAAGAHARAWSRVDGVVAKRIDRHLAHAGVA